MIATDETPTLNVGQKFEIVNLIEQHYDTRPDIIVAGLLCSQHEHIRKEVERAIKRHGFTGLIINITNIDDDVLNELNTLLSHKEIHDLIPTGPYLNEIKSHHIENSAVFKNIKTGKLFAVAYTSQWQRYIIALGNHKLDCLSTDK